MTLAKKNEDFDPWPEVELRDSIDASCNDCTDRGIVRLREEGYQDYEIAKQLGIGPTTVYDRRRAIYGRLLESLEISGEV